MLQAQEYRRLKGLAADLVVVNENPSGYVDAMHASLGAQLADGPWRSWRHQPGGVYLLRGERLAESERILLQSAANAVLSGDRGELSHQLDRLHPDKPLPPPVPFTASAAPTGAAATAPRQALPALTFDNGRGGFAAGGREYLVQLEGDEETPLPWVT